MERSRVRPLGDLERPRDRGSGGWRDAIGMVNKENCTGKNGMKKRERENERNELRKREGRRKRRGFHGYSVVMTASYREAGADQPD